MEKNPGKLIFTAYQDDKDDIHLGVAPEFSTYTNGKEYFINLGNTFIKMSFELIKKLEDDIKASGDEENAE